MCIITTSIIKLFCFCDQNYALYAFLFFSFFIFRNQHLKMPVCVCSSLIVSSLMMKILWKSKLCQSGTVYACQVMHIHVHLLQNIQVTFICLGGQRHPGKITQLCMPDLSSTAVRVFEVHIKKLYACQRVNSDDLF